MIIPVTYFGSAAVDSHIACIDFRTADIDSGIVDINSYIACIDSRLIDIYCDLTLLIFIVQRITWELLR